MANITARETVGTGDTAAFVAYYREGSFWHKAGTRHNRKACNAYITELVRSPKFIFTTETEWKVVECRYDALMGYCGGEPPRLDV